MGRPSVAVETAWHQGGPGPRQNIHVVHMFLKKLPTNGLLCLTYKEADAKEIKSFAPQIKQHDSFLFQAFFYDLCFCFIDVVLLFHITLLKGMMKSMWLMSEYMDNSDNSFCEMENCNLGSYLLIK